MSLIVHRRRLRRVDFDALGVGCLTHRGRKDDAV